MDGEYWIEEMILREEAENRGYKRATTKQFIKSNIDFVKHINKNLEIMNEEDIEKYIAEIEANYSESTILTIRTHVVQGVRIFKRNFRRRERYKYYRNSKYKKYSKMIFDESENRGYGIKYIGSLIKAAIEIMEFTDKKLEKISEKDINIFMAERYKDYKNINEYKSKIKVAKNIISRKSKFLEEAEKLKKIADIKEYKTGTKKQFLRFGMMILKSRNKKIGELTEEDLEIVINSIPAIKNLKWVFKVIADEKREGGNDERNS